MKKSLFLATIIGLLPLAPSAWGEELEWNNEDKTVDWARKTWDPTIWGAAWDTTTVPEWVNVSTTLKNFEFSTENKLLIVNGNVDLDGICFWNNVIFATKDGKEPSTAAGANAAYNPKIESTDDGAYTYGGLLIKAGSNVSMSESTGDSTAYSKYTSVGTLALENDAKLTITDRKLTVTGLPYTSLGSGAVIELSAATKSSDSRGSSEGRTDGGMLSMGASEQLHWDAVVVSGANGGAGTITNKSATEAVLGTESAKHVEYSNVFINVQGNKDETEITAKLGNATIYNGTNRCEVVVSGGISEGASIAVSQVSTGIKTDNEEKSAYGNVTLLNRGTDTLMMDSIFLADRTTLASHLEGRGSSVSTIEMNAFNSELNSSIDVGAYESYGLILQREATLDADLILGTGDTDEAVVFGFWTLEQHEYMSNAATSMSLNMVGNNVTLRKGIALMSFDIDEAPTAPSEILLFSNVDQLTLADHGTFDGEGGYFTYEDGISAADYFSTSLTDDGTLNALHLSMDEPDADGKGWYIEYRANADDMTGNVYLVYMIPEPTTATLSLLALAGLAARRRRK